MPKRTPIWHQFATALPSQVRSTLLPTIITLLTLLPSSLHAEEAEQTLPETWRVIVHTRNSYPHNPKHSRKVELYSTGRVVETLQSQKPEQPPINRKLDAADTLAGLHLVLTVLEEAPLKSPLIFDADLVTATIETDHWRWSRAWNTTENLEKANPRLVMFFEFAAGRKKLDAKSLRTKHLSPKELVAKWQAEWKKLAPSGASRREWQGSWRIGEDAIRLSPVDQGWRLWRIDKLKASKTEIEASAVELASLEKMAIETMDDLVMCRDNRDRAAGKMELGFTLSAGGGITSISLLGVDKFSDAGPNADKLFSKAQAALAKGTTEPK